MNLFRSGAGKNRNNNNDAQEKPTVEKEAQSNSAGYDNGAPDPRSAPSPDVTVLGSGTSISGNLDIKGSLHVYGHLEGNIQCDGPFIIQEDGSVRGEVIATDVTISGIFDGNIECRVLNIRDGGTFKGVAAADTLSIEQGALFEGESRRRTPDNVTRLMHDKARNRI